MEKVIEMDENGEIDLTGFAEPGEVFSVVVGEDGTIVLTRVAEPQEAPEAEDRGEQHRRPRKLSFVGSIEDGPSDLSTNPEHMRGFGETRPALEEHYAKMFPDGRDDPEDADGLATDRGLAMMADSYHEEEDARLEREDR